MVTVCAKCFNTCKKPNIINCENFTCNFGQQCSKCNIMNYCKFSTYNLLDCPACQYSGIMHVMTIRERHMHCPICFSEMVFAK